MSNQIKKQQWCKNGKKKKNLKDHFGIYRMNFFGEFDLYIDFVFIIFMFYAKILFKVRCVKRVKTTTSTHKKINRYIER